jgi:hypothetical protein
MRYSACTFYSPETVRKITVLLAKTNKVKHTRAAAAARPCSPLALPDRFGTPQAHA